MKSYISRKFPLETRMTDQTFDFRSAERLIGPKCCQSWPFAAQRRRPRSRVDSSLVLFQSCASPEKNFTCHCCEAEADNGRPLHMRIHTVMDELGANLARRASLAEDCCVADFPPPMARLFTRPASIQAESGAMR